MCLSPEGHHSHVADIPPVLLVVHWCTYYSSQSHIAGQVLVDLIWRTPDLHGPILGNGWVRVVAILAASPPGRTTIEQFGQQLSWSSQPM